MEFGNEIDHNKGTAARKATNDSIGGNSRNSTGK